MDALLMKLMSAYRHNLDMFLFLILKKTDGALSVYRVVQVKSEVTTVESLLIDPVELRLRETMQQRVSKSIAHVSVKEPFYAKRYDAYDIAEYQEVGGAKHEYMDPHAWMFFHAVRCIHLDVVLPS